LTKIGCYDRRTIDNRISRDKFIDVMSDKIPRFRDIRDCVIFNACINSQTHTSRSKRIFNNLIRVLSESALNTFINSLMVNYLKNRKLSCANKIPRCFALCQDLLGEYRNSP